MPDTALIVAGLLCGSIGFGYFLYGRKQGHTVARYSGIALMVLPYFISSWWLVAVLSVMLMLLPCYLKL